ncbi:MAG TPA: hypothetical protein EYP58_02980 [bacterium (Candidatus Stahlbacteria)]|nr:hypothetical protein [Candidatus Stahlbacteria bacterium]
MHSPIFSLYLKQIVGTFSPQRRQMLIKKISFIIVVMIFLIGSGYFFFRIFDYLATVSDFGLPLMVRIIESLLLVFFFMILFSNFITAITTYFRSAELDYFFSLPINLGKIFVKKYIETSVYASWASMVVVIPMMFSYGLVRKASLFDLLLVLLTIILYIQIASALGSAIVLVLLKIFPKLSSKFSIAAVSLGGILAYLYFLLGKPGVFRVFEIQSMPELTKFIDSLGQIGSAYLPSNWLAAFVTDIFSGNFNPRYLGLLFFSALALFLLLSEFGSRFYRLLWLKQRDLLGKGKRRFAKLLQNRLKGNQAILVKDVIVFTRDPTQWIQLLIFFILILIYIFSIYRTRFIFTSPFWRIVIGFANFAYISFLFATLGVRFIYPSISQEGRCFLLLKSSPIGLRRLLYSKFLIYSTVTIIIGEILLLVTSKILYTDPLIFTITGFGLALVLITMVSINLGIGAMLPDFNEQNPAKLAAGGGGVIAALICLGYTFFTIILFARPALYYLKFRGSLMLPFPVLVNFFIFILGSTMLIIIFLAISIKHLERIEL